MPHFSRLYRSRARHGNSKRGEGWPSGPRRTLKKRATLTKQRVLAEGQLVVRFDEGTTADIAPRTEDALIERLEHWQPRVDAVIVSDYGYGVLTDRVIARLAELQRATPRLLVVDAKDYRAYRRVKPTVAKPNFEEATRARKEGRPPVFQD